MFMNKPYMITIEHPVADKYLDITEKGIERVTGHYPQRFIGTTPDNWPPVKYLTFADKKAETVNSPEKPWSETEKACWYSHYTLWKKLAQLDYCCWIFEHDVRFSRHMGFLPSEDTVKHSPQIVMFGSGIGSGEAYCASPKVLRRWVEEAEKNPLTYQVDTWLYDFFKKRKHYVPLALGVTYQATKYGTTIQH